MINYRKNHDLSLSSWGPYSKRYIGISHIPSAKDGMRIDFSIFPSLYRRGITVPNVLWESDYHPWESSPDLHYYTHRHELLWKDQVYTDMSFSIQDESSTLFRCRTVNNTNTVKAVVYHHMANICFPPVKTYSAVPVESVQPPENGETFFIPALSYNKLHMQENDPRRTLSPDGTLWGETRDHGFSNGSGLGNGFGNDSQDKASYRIPADWDKEGNIFIRWRGKKESSVTFNFSKGLKGSIKADSTGDWSLLKLRTLVQTEKDEFDLSIEESQSIELDGFLFCNKTYTEVPEFHPHPRNAQPEIIPGPSDQSLILKYEGVDSYYGITWEIPSVIRQWECDEVDSIMKHNVHEHNDKLFQGKGDGHYTEAFSRPIYLPPYSEQNHYGIICQGDYDMVRRELEKFPENKSVLIERIPQSFETFKNEDEWSFSINRLAATSLLNIVYPVSVQNQWIRHHTPGKWWDCLYTWDSGFIGIGFTSIDLVRAEETLNTYLTLPENPHAAFIHHGSPVPVQFFLYQSIFNKTGSLEFLDRYFDSLLQYHRFLAGRLGSSSTGALSSQLLKTWDYFYNCGGWDDYCPQVYIRKNNLEDAVTPVITTSMAIRTALILKGAARLLDRPSEEFDNDIRTFSEALQNHSWDKDSGYFSYVVHDESGEAIGFLKDENGKNFNAGFDGAYPLVAGICTSDQEDVLIEKLFSPLHLWTETGLTAIDQSAPYFRDDGYWNGAVWMSHQWFFWKSLLDVGEGDKAFKIALTALKLWKKEVERTYNCFEHFITSTGEGGGWHHFGGLSSPLLDWYTSYYNPGKVSAGHDTWVLRTEFSEDKKKAEISLMSSGYKKKKSTVIIVMNPETKNAKVKINGTHCQSHIRFPGLIEVSVPKDRDDYYTLVVEAI